MVVLLSKLSFVLAVVIAGLASTSEGLAASAASPTPVTVDIAVWGSHAYNGRFWLTGVTREEIGSSACGPIPLFREATPGGFDFVEWNTLGGDDCDGGPPSPPYPGTGSCQGEDCGETCPRMLITPANKALLLTESRPHARLWELDSSETLASVAINHNGNEVWLHWGLGLFVDEGADKVVYVLSGDPVHLFPSIPGLDTNNNAIYVADSSTGYLPGPSMTSTLTGSRRMVCFGVAKYDGKYWISGGKNTPGVDWRDPGAQRILSSDDGGVSWNDETLPGEIDGALLALIAFDGKLFAGTFGGASDASRKAEIWEYDGASWTLSWSSVPNGAFDRIDAFYEFDNLLYASGGNGSDDARVMVYDPATDNWSVVWQSSAYTNARGFMARDGALYFWAIKPGTSTPEESHLFRILDGDVSHSTVVLESGATGNRGGLVGCSANTSATKHADPCVARDFVTKVTVLDSQDQPVAGVWPYIDFSDCLTADPLFDTFPDLRPATVYTDAPTDANGEAVFVGGQILGGATFCEYAFQVAGQVLGDSTRHHLRPVDVNGSGDVTNGDLALLQQAFTGTRPVYYGDYNLDWTVSLADLSTFNPHLQHDVSGGCATQVVSSELTQASLDGSPPIFYFHITDRYPDHQLPPAVLPSDAQAGATVSGATQREVTVWLYAVGASGIDAAQVEFDVPAGWVLERGNHAVLDRQIYGAAEGYDAERGRYATAFSCIRDDGPIVIGRFDAVARRNGTLSLRLGAPIVVVDCGGRERELAPRSIGGATGALFAAEGSADLEVRQIGSSTGTAFTLAITAGQSAVVESAVYDAAGRLIRRFADLQAAGEKHVAWDGRRANGLPAPSGTYFFEVHAGGRRFVERLLLVR